MRRLPPVLIVAIAATAGAVLTLGVGLATLGSTDVEHLLVPIAIAIALTVIVSTLGARLLAGASIGTRFAAIGAFASVIGIANLGVLAWLMAVSEKEALLVATLLIYAAGAAVGAGLATARASTIAFERVSAVARRMAAGDLEARCGPVGGGAELQRLATTLDEMAAQLAESLRRERATEAQRRDLVVAVSHDLRTPLADLRAMAEAINDGVVADRATVRSYNARMVESVASLSLLIDDLFEFVQLDAGAIEAETRRARIENVVRSAVAACDLQAAQKGLHVRTELGNAGSASCSPRLTRVVQNLLQNAIRHTPADGTVRVVARQADDGIELAIEDSGEGMDSATVERIFEPFWRGDAARASDGTGLGLAVAKRIVEALGGSIAVSSEPAHGSRFAVLIPEHR